MNLPGKKGYGSDLPWVMKIRWDGHLACEVFLYVDDGHATGFFREICWAAARQVASFCTKHGVQDKAVKRTFPSHLPAAWAGAVSRTDQGEVVGIVSDKKCGQRPVASCENWWVCYLRFWRKVERGRLWSKLGRGLTDACGSDEALEICRCTISGTDNQYAGSCARSSWKSADF